LLRSFCFEATHRPGLPFQDLMTAHTIHQGLPIDLRITGVFGANKKDKLDAPPTWSLLNCLPWTSMAFKPAFSSF
jgi:hypothetical protein